MSLESLSKEEIIQKYKGLLGIAKKAKQAKDGKYEDETFSDSIVKICWEFLMIRKRK